TGHPKSLPTASIPLGPPMGRRINAPVSSTSTTDISLTTVSGSTKTSIKPRRLAQALNSCASCLRMVSPGARGGLRVDFDLFLRNGLDTIVLSTHGCFLLIQLLKVTARTTEDRHSTPDQTNMAALWKSPDRSVRGDIKLLYNSRKAPMQTNKIKGAYNMLLKATHIPSRGVINGASW